MRVSLFWFGMGDGAVWQVRVPVHIAVVLENNLKYNTRSPSYLTAISSTTPDYRRIWTNLLHKKSGITEIPDGF